MAVTLLDAWLNFSKANTVLQQFGQKDDESTYNGATGCTHTVLQRLIKAKSGAYVSHDEVSRVATYPWPVNNPGKRGMYSGGSDNEVGKVVSHYNLPYVLRYDLTWDQIITATAKGPVLIGIRYGYWPEWSGYRYMGYAADGKPGGFAYRHGKTQLVGAEKIYHATLILGRRYVKGVYRTYANEPNHGSGSRPEKPDYDSVRSAYAKRAYLQYASDGRRLFAWVPTTTFRPKGY